MAVDDPVQPDDEGQGSESTGSPYQEYLDRIPEEARAEAEQAFRDWDAKTTQRFQEAAEYRKQWEPLEQLGVNQRDPAEIEWAMQFVDALDNPQAIQQWFNDYAAENGLTAAEQAELEQQYVDPDAQALVEKQLQTHLGPVAQQMQEFSEWRQAQELAAAQEMAMSQIQDEISQLKEKHGSEFNESMIEKLLPQYIESDPEHAVQLAFRDWQQIQADIQKSTLQQKADQPLGAESGGGVSATEEPPSPGEAMKHASARALEMLRANNRT